MRALIITMLLLLSYQCYAQTDLLIVRLKSGVTDTLKVSEINSIKFENVTAVSEAKTAFTDPKNFPNPFSESTTIEFELARSGDVEILIYDNTGNVIRKLNCSDCQAGINTLNWDTKNQKGDAVPSGIYYYEIRQSNNIFLKQMIKVR